MTDESIGPSNPDYTEYLVGDDPFTYEPEDGEYESLFSDGPEGDVDNDGPEILPALKYPPGTKLKVVYRGHDMFKEGNIIIVKLSEMYPFDYAFENYPDHGWSKGWIEDKKEFIVIPSKITNWKERII